CVHTHVNKEFIADLIITVDCSDITRLGNRAHYLEQSKKVVNIDHHITNTYFAQHNLVVSDAAATGEIVYLLLQEMDVSITKDTATCLYVALSTDTGSFRYDNTTAGTHRIAAELLEYGIDLNFITTELYQNKPLSKVKLLKEALNSLEIYYSGQVAILSITNQMLKETGAAEDTDGLIEFARDIVGVKVGILIKELGHSEIKVGFRSKDNRIDVSEIAAQFGGGGHRKASGCTIHDTLQNAKEQVVAILKNYL
ncbi:MAG TPA: bifunctional oligoribonuclease/PAP phosphatase NrnA, partial [Clostridiales bacterium]|nr:bifunctional oligoribonuclease/PAP phosphatase NrnA [Clostridiales bacterium]